MTPSVSFSARHDPLAPLLVVLHDDGSDEREAMAAGRWIWPGAPIACIRGHYRERKSWQHLSQSETAALDLEASTVDRLSDLIANTARREPQTGRDNRCGDRWRRRCVARDPLLPSRALRRGDSVLAPTEVVGRVSGRHSDGQWR